MSHDSPQHRSSTGYHAAAGTESPPSLVSTPRPHFQSMRIVCLSSGPTMVGSTGAEPCTGAV